MYWDMTLLFADQTEFERSVVVFKKSLTNLIDTFEIEITTYEQLKRILFELECIFMKWSQIYYYGILPEQVEKDNYVAISNRKVVLDLKDELDNILFKIEENIFNFISKEEYFSLDFKMKRYLPYLENIIRKFNTTNDKDIINIIELLKSNIFNSNSIYNATKYGDLKFPDFSVGNHIYTNSFVKFEQGFEYFPDREVRKKSWESFVCGLEKYQHTVGANFISHVLSKKKISKLMGYESVFDYLLYQQNFSGDEYNKVLDEVMNKFGPVMRKYANLLSKKNNGIKINTYDLKTPVFNTEQLDLTISKAKELILNSVEMFGDKYTKIIGKCFDNRWIDFRISDNKVTGCFCETIYNGPSYILINWNRSINELFSLSHELGHAGHYQLTYENQSVLTPDNSNCFIEAPSTTNEVLLGLYLLKNLNNDVLKREVISSMLSKTYFHNMVTHFLEAEFQRRIYKLVDENSQLTVEILNKTYLESFYDFWGETVNATKGTELTWMRQPHYYLPGLYPYSYVVGLIIGTHISNRIYNNEENLIARWIEILKVGGAKSSEEILAKLDIDLFDDQTYGFVSNFVLSLINQLGGI